MFIVKPSLLLLSGVCLAALSPSIGHAQPKPNSLVGTIPTRVITYSAGILGLSPAASATDFFTLVGSATAVIRVKSLECTSTSTVAASIALQLVRRSSADSGGTRSTLAITSMDSTDAAATAAAFSYTVNPTGVGTLTAGAMVRTAVLFSGTTASSLIGAPVLRWNFGTLNDKEPMLRGAGQTLALNANGASFASGSAVNCDVEWTESPN